MLYLVLLFSWLREEILGMSVSWKITRPTSGGSFFFFVFPLSSLESRGIPTKRRESRKIIYLNVRSLISSLMTFPETELSHSSKYNMTENWCTREKRRSRFHSAVCLCHGFPFSPFGCLSRLWIILHIAWASNEFRSCIRVDTTRV
jgi:hypothetical protein